MITLTVLVIVLGLGWAINRAWTFTTELLARKAPAPKAETATVG